MNAGKSCTRQSGTATNWERWHPRHRGFNVCNKLQEKAAGGVLSIIIIRAWFAETEVAITSATCNGSAEMIQVQQFIDNLGRAEAPNNGAGRSKGDVAQAMAVQWFDRHGRRERPPSGNILVNLIASPPAAILAGPLLPLRR